MTKSNMIEFKGDAAPDNPQARVEAASSNSDERIEVKPGSLRRGRHLDVDEVLARSLPKAQANRDVAPRTKSLAN